MMLRKYAVTIAAVAFAGHASSATPDAPSGYSPNNPDSSSEMTAEWVAEAKRFEAAKLKLIHDGKIVIDHAPSKAVMDYSPKLPGNDWNVMNGAEAKPCGFYFIVPPKSPGGTCEKRRGPDEPAGQEPNWQSTAGDAFSWLAALIIPVRKLYTKGYSFNDHFAFVKFMILDHQNFEQRLLLSPQIGASVDKLFANSRMYPTLDWDAAPPVPVKITNNDGTLLLVAQFNSSGKLKNYARKYSTCIYSIHGNDRRSAESMTCFFDVNKNYSNKYVEQYLTVLNSILMD